MAKTILPSLPQLASDFPQVTFQEADYFCWSAPQQRIYYKAEALTNPKAFYHLLHELGHALRAHTTYGSGIQLIKLEAEAWQAAQEIAKRYQLHIKSSLIESCLDSYRDWLHLRSTCPTCQSIATEHQPYHYHCFNCAQKWKVSPDQRQRCYRLKLSQAGN